MLKVAFETINKFEDHYNSHNSYVRDKCSCGGIIEMNLSTCKVIIGDCEINVNECPILVCQNCKQEYLGNFIPQMLYDCYIDMKRNSVIRAKVRALNNQKFNFAKNKDFIYDCRDLNIPGLDIDFDPTHAGFSCPVFFEKKVLNNFLFDEDYEMNLFSETYGYIAKKGTGGWQWEWHINFGINSNGKIVMFLGDLDQIDDDDKAVYWLKSYNIESDHTIINSELYQAQLNCKFSDPIIEKQLIELRNSFFNRIMQSDGIDLFHLQEAFENLSNELSKPINYTKQEIKSNVVLLDNLLNEAINCVKLRELYEKRVNSSNQEYKKYKSIKLLLGILSAQLSSEEANRIISPLFNLKDLRDCFSHILPQNKVEPIKQRIVDAYGLASFEEYEKLYNSLIERLLKLFKYLNYAEI